MACRSIKAVGIFMTLNKCDVYVTINTVCKFKYTRNLKYILQTSSVLLMVLLIDSSKIYVYGGVFDLAVEPPQPFRKRKKK